VAPGEIVAMYLMNRPEFMFCWLGLLAIGASPALVNYNLSYDVLMHCIQIAGARLMVVDPDESCVRRVQEVSTKLDAAGVEVIVLREDIQAAISSLSDTPPLRRLRQKRTPLGLLYTR
jgi:acyl-CoA synthetase (AMP-forming)/AMP-acid ligase II